MIWRTLEVLNTVYIVAGLIMLAMVLTLEEREALAKFGEDYRDYRRRVPAFSLRPDCLRRLLLEVPPADRQTTA